MDTITRAMTVEEFIIWEEELELRHEFDGERPIPMTGASHRHDRIVTRLMAALLEALQPALLPLPFNRKVHAGTSQVRYPDLVIVRDPVPDPASTFDVRRSTGWRRKECVETIDLPEVGVVLAIGPLYA